MGNKRDWTRSESYVCLFFSINKTALPIIKTSLFWCQVISKYMWEQWWKDRRRKILWKWLESKTSTLLCGWGVISLFFNFLFSWRNPLKTLMSPLVFYIIMIFCFLGEEGGNVVKLYTSSVPKKYNIFFILNVHKKYSTFYFSTSLYFIFLYFTIKVLIYLHKYLGWPIAQMLTRIY